MGEVTAKLLDVVWSLQGQEAGRNFYKSLLNLPAAGGDFFHAILDKELACQADSGKKLEEKEMQALFEVGPTPIRDSRRRSCNSDSKLQDS